MPRRAAPWIMPLCAQRKSVTVCPSLINIMRRAREDNTASFAFLSFSPIYLLDLKKVDDLVLVVAGDAEYGHACIIIIRVHI